MNTIVKKLLKMLVKGLPGYPLRAFLLRLAGYQVGSHVFIGEELIIVDEPKDRGLVSIGDRVAISPRVTLVVSSRPNNSRIAPFVPVKHARIVIEDDAWLGAGVVVLPGVRIGAGAVVAANAVVIADVPAYTIVGGIPAHVIREVSVPWIQLAQNPEQ